MSELMSIMAGLFMVATVVSYWLQVKRAVSTPNPATWLIWSVVSIMNAFSYFRVVEEDTLKVLAAIVSAVGLSFVFIYTWRMDKFSKIGWVEVVSIILTLGVGLLWKIVGAVSANLSLQLVLVISFYPTIRGLLKRKLREKPLPWVLAVAAQFFQIGSLILDWDTSGGWIALAYPLLNGVLGNGSVAMIVYLQAKQKDVTH